MERRRQRAQQEAKRKQDALALARYVRHQKAQIREEQSWRENFLAENTASQGFHRKVER